MPDLVEDIKSRLTIEQLVGGYVQLKKAGKNFKACCPFHAEKTPSFVVSPDKGLAWCFGCQKGGDMFTFIQEVEGVDFKQALEILAEKAGLNAEEYRTTSSDVKNYAPADKRQRLFDLHEAACRFYQSYLKSDADDARQAREYFATRGITEQTIRDFRLGFAPDSFEATLQEMMKQKFTKQELIDAGLVVSKETGGQHVYDRFRNRLIFPLFSHTGQVIAFAGRVLTGDETPKYLNSPETPIYKKGSTLYGYKAARSSIKEHGYVVLVEGYMDVLASHQAGIHQVVASCGTALTIKQAKTLTHLCQDFRLSFDTDSAGKMAARRSIELLQPLDIAIKIVSIPDGKDPDELISKEPSLWLKALDDAHYYFDYLLESYHSSERTLDMKKHILSDLIPLLKRVKSTVERDTYVKKLATLLETTPAIVYSELKNYSAPAYMEHEQPQKTRSVGKEKVALTLSRYFLSLLLAYPFLLQEIGEYSVYEKYFTEGEKTVYLKLTSQYNGQAHFEEIVDFFSDFSPEQQQSIAVLALYAENKNQLFTAEEPLKNEIQKICAKLLADDRKSRYQQLSFALKKAKQAGDSEKVKEIFSELSTLIHS